MVVRKNAESIITEHERSNSLKKATRCKLMGYLVDLIDEEYAGKASSQEITYICEATIMLFPSLRDEDGGIVSFT